MKLTKSEKCAIIICLIFLALAAGFAFGQKQQEGVFVVRESSFSAETAREYEQTTDFPRDESAIININTADAAALESLEGIGPVLAERIIEYRETVGSFKKIEDITKVRGIGAAVFEDIRLYICVE